MHPFIFYLDMAAEDYLIKKAFKKVLYTDKQIEELKKCMDPINGPMYFMTNFVYIQHPTKGRLLFKPFPYQVGLLEAFHNYRYSIAMLGRQLGKSTVAGSYLLWYAMFVPDSFILVASKTGGDAKEIMGRIRFAYESLPDHIRAGAITYNKHSIEFDNGSKIKSTTTTENTGRGMSISLVYLDEMAFVPYNVAIEMWTSLSPTLSTGGKCIITSTPNTDEDLFADIWHNANKLTDEYGNERKIGANGFKPFKATWKDHPDRDENWATIEREKIGEERFRREHEVEFISFEETLINSIKLNQLESKTPIRKTGQVRWYEEIKPTNTYVVGLDPSMGAGGDNAAIQVLELPTMKQVAEWQHNRTPVEGQVRLLNEILTEIQNAGVVELYWSLESNNLGEAALVVIRDTGEEYFPGTFLHDPVKQAGANSRKRQGFLTTNRTKIEACSRLKSLIENNKIKISSSALISELKNYVHRGSTFEARPGTTDDLVSALILTLRMTQFIALWDDNTNGAISASIEVVDEDDDSMPMPFLF
ncbi:hypothetical protein RVBP17_1140 [Pseudomonas phage sp. 30-3]|nr:hypothetical protein RVBP16_2830 [Pseudomonas phage sp. 30-2]BDR26071.1 hypothetical protein RVBP17_1140 [Pseudomonas phage sp. 30-3]